VKPGGVYMGVGPEENFTYIAALKPSMVFIVGIRRGNLDLHLFYKALFELSTSNVATLLLDETSRFIRSYRGGRGGWRGGLAVELGEMQSDTKSCR
jgi:hypothetical protein